uniref:solute carrier family 26 member 6-like n=1 Tax=Monopterus albus TaxID=43700 RepID=UPI0009B4E455|nr:solute carrier family 26 member 6-like [Monopterus albus]
MQLTDVYTLWKTNKIDMVVWLVTFACTILLNLDIGLAAAVGFSLFVYIIRSQLPRYYILGLVPDTALYLDIETYKEAKEIPGIKIFSTSATLYHINAQRFTEALEKKTGFDLEKLLTTKRKRDEALKRKEEKEIKKAKKLAKNQNQLNRRLFSGIFALKKSKIEEGGFPAELSGQNQVNLTDFKQAGISTIDLGTGQVNWAYQHDLGPGDNNLPPVTYHGDEDKESSSESRTHSIILDISKTSFVDINTVNVLKKIFSDFGELDVAIYLSGCQACVVKQLDTAGFFSEQIPKSRLFVTVHDAVLYILKTQTQKDVILDVPCYTQM